MKVVVDNITAACRVSNSVNGENDECRQFLPYNDVWSWLIVDYILYRSTRRPFYMYDDQPCFDDHQRRRVNVDKCAAFGYQSYAAFGWCVYSLLVYRFQSVIWFYTSKKEMTWDQVYFSNEKFQHLYKKYFARFYAFLVAGGNIFQWPCMQSSGKAIIVALKFVYNDDDDDDIWIWTPSYYFRLLTSPILCWTFCC